MRTARSAVVAQTGREVEWINRYVDQQRVRGVADSTLRSYAHDLLHFPPLVGNSASDFRHCQTGP